MAQTPGIGVLGMGDPGSDMPAYLVLGNAAGANAIAQPAPAVAEAAQILLRQTPPARRQHIAEKGRGLGRRADHRLAGMQ